jgi:hypothetical protein
MTPNFCTPHPLPVPRLMFNKVRRFTRARRRPGTGRKLVRKGRARVLLSSYILPSLVDFSLVTFGLYDNHHGAFTTHCEPTRVSLPTPKPLPMCSCHRTFV